MRYISDCSNFKVYAFEMAAPGSTEPFKVINGTYEFPVEHTPDARCIRECLDTQGKSYWGHNAEWNVELF